MIPTITRGDAMIDVNTLPACPVETTLTLISDKWKILIVRDLLTGTKRFSELRRSIGHISQKVLTSNLRQMEADGLVHREVYPEVPPRVEYALTPRGESLMPHLVSLIGWALENFDAIVSDRNSLQATGPDL